MAAKTVPADPGRFDEAVEAFRARVPMTDDEFEAIEGIAHDRAFTVAGVAQLDVVNDVWTEIDRALEQGSSFDDFKAAVADKLEKAWGGSKPWRIENIFRTNLQGAYGAGRVKQLTAPAVLKARPFWKFSAVLDGRTSTICRPLAGLVMPANDASWADKTPPLHFQCRSTLIPLTVGDAEAAGVAAEAPEVEAEDGFGRADSYERWTPEITDYPRPLQEAFEKRKKAG